MIVRCIFELHRRGAADGVDTLLHASEESVHVDALARRAKTMLWTSSLTDRQDLVLVRKAATGRELYRRTIGTTYRAAR